MTPTSLLTHVLMLISLAAPPQTAPAKGQAVVPGRVDRQGDLFTEIFKRGVVKQRTMKSVRANFTETTTSTLLVKPLVARGTLIAASPARMRMTYTEPEAKLLVTDGKQLTVVWPARNQREQIDIRDVQKRIDQYFRSASIEDLRKMFEIRAEIDASNPRAYHVDMRPTRKQIKQGLERLQLWIDRESDMLVQMRLSFPGGDEKTIALDNVAMDVPIAADTFEVRP